jgi:hypothetical protein
MMYHINRSANKKERKENIKYRIVISGEFTTHRRNLVSSEACPQ